MKQRVHVVLLTGILFACSMVSAMNEGRDNTSGDKIGQQEVQQKKSAFEFVSGYTQNLIDNTGTFVNSHKFFTVGAMVTAVGVLALYKCSWIQNKANLLKNTFMLKRK